MKGFTVVELLVVVTIIAFLSAVGLVSFQNIQARAKDAKIRTDLDAIKKAYEQNFDPSLNGGQGGYRVITGANFAGGQIPTQPNGSPYPCVVGPSTDCTMQSNSGYQISATLSDGSTVTATSNQGIPIADILPLASCTKFNNLSAGQSQNCLIFYTEGGVAPIKNNPAGGDSYYIKCADINLPAGVSTLNCSALCTQRTGSIPHYSSATATSPSGSILISGTLNCGNIPSAVTLRL